MAVWMSMLYIFLRFLCPKQWTIPKWLCSFLGNVIVFFFLGRSRLYPPDLFLRKCLTTCNCNVLCRCKVESIHQPFHPGLKYLHITFAVLAIIFHLQEFIVDEVSIQLPSALVILISWSSAPAITSHLGSVFCQFTVQWAANKVSPWLQCVL